ncbi:MAG: sugar ABC transporter permease [Clostridiales bacterium]|nr:sugar ABC transporter permease [Clostridiales bacterium]
MHKAIKWSDIKRQLIAYTFILPNLMGVILFTLAPVAFSLVISFSSWDYVSPLSQISFTGLDNYMRMWTDNWFLASVRNNLIYALATVPSAMALALAFACIVERFCKGKSVIRLLLYSTNIISTVVAAYVWQMMLSQKGLIPSLLSGMGIKGVPFFLGDTKWALWVLIAMAVWTNLGYIFVLYMAGLQNVPEELYDACTVDGCGEFQRFIHITVPMIAPTTFFILVTQIIFSFRVFTPVQLLTHGGPGSSTYMLAYYVYVSAFQYYEMGYSASITWVLFAFIFIFTMLQWKMQDKWVAS